MDNVVLRVWAGNIPVKHKALPKALKKVGNVLETPECYFGTHPRGIPMREFLDLVSRGRKVHANCKSWMEYRESELSSSAHLSCFQTTDAE